MDVKRKFKCFLYFLKNEKDRYLEKFKNFSISCEIYSCEFKAFKQKTYFILCCKTEVYFLQMFSNVITDTKLNDAYICRQT